MTSRTLLRLLSALLSGWLLFMLGAAPAHASDPPTQPLEVIFAARGERLGVVHDGAGTFDRTEADVELDVPGDAVRRAYLLWAGLGRDDDGVFLARDGTQPIRVTADRVWNNTTFGGDTWNCCAFELSVYLADVTALGVVQTGPNLYTVSDMEVTATSGGENWGTSLIVVYEDATIATPQDVIVKLGNDGFHYRWGGPLGPNSDVQCVSFPPADFDRTVGFTTVIGGIKDIYRPNGLWARSGNEAYVDDQNALGTWTQSRGLIDGVSGIAGIGGAIEVDGPLDGDWTGNGVDWPYTDNRSDQWDVYPPFQVSVPADGAWACVQIESANRPEIQPVEGTFQRGASIGFLGLIAVFPSEAPPAEPGIELTKYTNGEDANATPGPTIEVGDPVTWTYLISNTGSITLTELSLVDDREGPISCPQTTLAPGRSMICTAVGVAVEGQYVNRATVTAETETGQQVDSDDPSHYVGRRPDAPQIDLEKVTNGEDADQPPGPTLEVGQTVTWTYVVTNTGAEPLVDVQVTDDRIGAIVCPQTSLAVGESMICRATGIAESGQYANIGTVTGRSTDDVDVQDTDPSHYHTVPTGLREGDEPGSVRHVFVPYLVAE